MAQHDYVIDNSTGANVRSDINSVLQAIATNNSGSSAPSTTFASQFFADTSAGIMKLRNTSNNGFVNLFTLAGGIDVDAASNFNEDVTFTGASANIIFDKSADDLIFNDNAKAVFGTSSDGLEIFHNASDSIINDNGTGSLKLQLGGATKAEVVSGGFTVTGTCTATAFSGDGSGLTGVSGTTINDNANNRVITGSDTANTLQGESNLNWDGSHLAVGGSFNPSPHSIGIRSSDGSALSVGHTSATSNGSHDAQIVATDGSFFNNLKLTAQDVKIFTNNPSDGISETARFLDFGLSIGHGGTLDGNGERLTVQGTNVEVAYINHAGNQDQNALTIEHGKASGSNSGVMISFQDSSANAKGSISMSGTSTSYNTSSDYRLKENVVPLTDGIARLKTLTPYRFNFIEVPEVTVDGFLAHEVTAVPEAISGTKDETKDILYQEGDTIPSGKKVGDVKETVPVYQGIDQAKLVPLVVAALQEAITEIENLKTKVVALEAA